MSKAADDVPKTWPFTGDGLFAVDAQHRIILWNQGAEDILGYTPSDVVGRSCYDVIRGVDEVGGLRCSQDCQVIDGAQCNKLAFAHNLRCETKDGSQCWISLSHIFNWPIEGHLDAVVHIFRDVTEEVEAKSLLRSFANQMSEVPFLRSVETNSRPPNTELTSRENEVLALLVRGEGTSSIAKHLTISNTTARNHIQNILGKLGVHTRLEAVAHALRTGLVHQNAADSGSASPRDS